MLDAKSAHRKPRAVYVARLGVALSSAAFVGFLFEPPPRSCASTDFFWVLAGTAALGMLCGFIAVITDAAISLGVYSMLFGLTSFSMPGTLISHGSGPMELALKDVRDVVAAQLAYAQMSGGHFTSLACLAEPWACLDSYPEELGPLLAASALAPLSRHGGRCGYEHILTPGAPVEGFESAAFDGFVHVARPLIDDWPQACGDSTGVVLTCIGVSVEDGRCGGTYCFQ